MYHRRRLFGAKCFATLQPNSYHALVEFLSPSQSQSLLIFLTPQHL